MNIRTFPRPAPETQAKPKTDFLSVMSFVASPQRDSMDTDAGSEKDASPLTSPTTSVSSGASLSPHGLSSAQEERADRHLQSPSDSPQPPPATRAMVRHNHVSTVVLSGVAIVCLFIDGKERLCLAQISNTLLKRYSYNEIHNRRVALGITCVQCTPVQLEILRRAGAMPISSRRCGMITKREAERLVKSFLEETSPPKLPENFAFDVVHDCGWGCRGNFMPSRYNSSRAKCIKCTFCNMYFSPNKFIFHFHRTPDAKYNHPDAANFNSWRRHLKLVNSDSEELYHCWEDVKAMFNGGSRKRMLSGSSLSSSVSSSSTHSSTSHHHPSSTKSRPDAPREAPVKKMKFSEDQHPGPPRDLPTPAGTPYPQYPVFPMPNKFLPFRPPPNHPAFCMPPPYPTLGKELLTPNPDPRMMKAALPTWGSLPEPMVPPYEMIWAKHLGLSSVENGMAIDPRPPKHLGQREESAHRSASPTTVQISKPFMDRTEKDEAFLRMPDSQRLSAFRRVASHGDHSQTIDSSASGPTNGQTLSGANDVENDGDSDADEQVDVDTIDTDERDSEENNNNHDKNELSGLPTDCDSENGNGEICATSKTFSSSVRSSHSNTSSPTCSRHEPPQQPRSTSPGLDQPQSHLHQDRPGPTLEISRQECSPKVVDDARRDSNSSSEAGGSPEPSSADLQVLSKEELRKELLTEMEARRKLEIDCKTIKDTFQEQVDKEKQFRDEMAKQLQLVKDKLCQELDHERQVRFSLQQKLKEAHDALDSFSAETRTPLPSCTDCSTYRDSMVPR